MLTCDDLGSMYNPPQFVAIDIHDIVVDSVIPPVSRSMHYAAPQA
jgi:hypothetical protein